MRVANLGGYRSGNPPVGRVTEVPEGDPTIPLALNRWAAFEGCVRADDEVAHTRKQGTHEACPSWAQALLLDYILVNYTANLMGT